MCILYRGLVGVLIGLIFVCSISQATIAPTQKNPIVPAQWTQETLTIMIDNVSRSMGFNQSDIIKCLAAHESVWLKYPLVMDWNNQASIGLYHFQRATWTHFCVGRYHLINDIYNPILQTQCVINMWNDDLVPQHWKLSYLKCVK